MSRGHDDLGTLMRSARERDAGAPPFRRVWRAAIERRRQRRARRRLLLAAVPLAAAVLLAVVLLPPPDAGEPPPELVELARSLSMPEAPLDFLLEPPGGDLLGVEIPALAPETTTRPMDTDFEEIL